MKSVQKISIFLLGGAVLLLTFLLLLLLQLKNSSIRIITKLSPDGICSKVALSSGALYFKTEVDVYAELSVDERIAHKAKPKDYSPEYSKVFAVKTEDILHILNINPVQWCIPEQFVLRNENYTRQVHIIRADPPEADFCDDILYSQTYWNNNEGVFLSIETALPTKRWLRDNEISEGGSREVQHVKSVYGVMNSRIGNNAVSVLNCEFSPWSRLFNAYLITGNVAYFIKSNGMTQQEFVELLISICEASCPATKDPINALYELSITQ